MKIMKIGLIISILFILSIIPSWFIYTRFCLDKYEIKNDTLIFKNNIYVRNEYWSPSDDGNLGKAIGIGIGEKRTVTDLIWPCWVMEYKNDKEHNSIFMRGLMDLGSKYKKVSK